MLTFLFSIVMAARVEVSHCVSLFQCCVNPFCVFQSGVLDYGQL